MGREHAGSSLAGPPAGMWVPRLARTGVPLGIRIRCSKRDQGSEIRVMGDEDVKAR